jgi:saccharopine dehydrogenase-like NADP-dependent oxidoreductase
VLDLVEQYGAEVLASSRSEARVKRALADLKVPLDGVGTAAIDAHDGPSVARAIKDHDIDMVLNAAWYQTNLTVMDACLAGGAHYTDLGGFFDTTLKQLELSEAFRNAGLTAVVGLGSTPGITNLLGGAGAARLDKVDTIDIFCSWGNTLPVKEAGWPGYSIRTVLDEFTQEPVIWKDGKYQRVPVLSGELEVTMQEPIGKVKAHYVKHSEPATMGKTLGARNVAFRIGFPAHDLATFKTLTALGFADTRPLELEDCRASALDFLTAMYQRGIEEARGQPPPREEYEYDDFRVDVTGEKDGLPAHVTYFSTTWNDPGRGLPSARDTAVPPSVTCHWVVSGRIKTPGVFPVEAVVEDHAQFFRELGERKILIEEHFTHTTRFHGVQ